MTWFDSEADTVVIAEELWRRHWDIANRIILACKAHDIDVLPITTDITRNIWVRDYYPLQINDQFVQFTYKAKGYGGMLRYPQLTVSPKIRQMGFARAILSPITLDNGGNCVRFGDKAIVTDAIFRHNSRKGLIERLQWRLKAEVVVIPMEPGDEMGHADGIVHWINDHQVLVNDYSVMGAKYYATYEMRLHRALRSHGIEPVPFAYAYHKCPRYPVKQFRQLYPWADAINPAYGYYMNFVQVRGLILLPWFRIPEDDAATYLIRRHFPDCAIQQIDCSDLSMYGGLLNCVTASLQLRRDDRRAAPEPTRSS